MAHLQRLVIAADQRQDRQLHLTAAQQHYLYRVLRLQAGDRFIAMDGQGVTWIAVLVTPNQANLLELIATHPETSVSVTLAAALPKGSGFDEVVRQATEIGVTAIAPLISERTLLNPSSQKLDRWRRIAQEAAEQSERQIVPTILEPTPFLKWLEVDPSLTRYIAATRRDAPRLLQCLLAQPLPPTMTIAIGPEGGWTDLEIERAIAANYQPVSLGSTILRAVTAPVVALAWVMGAIARDDRESTL